MEQTQLDMKYMISTVLNNGEKNMLKSFSNILQI